MLPQTLHLILHPNIYKFFTHSNMLWGFFFCFFVFCPGWSLLSWCCTACYHKLSTSSYFQIYINSSLTQTCCFHFFLFFFSFSRVILDKLMLHNERPWLGFHQVNAVCYKLSICSCFCVSHRVCHSVQQLFSSSLWRVLAPAVAQQEPSKHAGSNLHPVWLSWFSPEAGQMILAHQLASGPDPFGQNLTRSPTTKSQSSVEEHNWVWNW